MPFINEDEVVALKSVDGDCLLAHLFPEFVNVDDLDFVTGEQTHGILVEQRSVQPGLIELFKVLF